MEMAYIYGLVDPRNQQLRYVGVAQNVQSRYFGHLQNNGKTHVTNWIKELRQIGMKPDIFVIEEIKDSQRKEAERFWIAYFKYIGADLTNITEGGEGCLGYKHTRESRNRMHLSHLGKPNNQLGRVKTQESKEKQSLAMQGRDPWNKGKKTGQVTWMKGKHFSSESLQRLSESHKGLPSYWLGKTRSTEDRIRMSLGHRGKKHRPMSEETKKKISDTRKERYGRGRNESGGNSVGRKFNERSCSIFAE